MSRRLVDKNWASRNIYLEKGDLLLLLGKKGDLLLLLGKKGDLPLLRGEKFTTLRGI